MKKLILICLVLFASTAFAQNSRFDGVVQSRSGFPAPGAKVAICTQPCTVPANVSITNLPSPLASLCSSTSDAVCAQPNPVTADGLGNYNGYVAPGRYTVVFFGTGLTGRTQPDQMFACDPSNCKITSLTVTGASSLASVTASGNVSIKGPVPWADVTQYGLVGDNLTDNTAAFNTMMTTICASNQAHTVYFPITSGGNYLFNSAPAAIGCEVVIRCGYDSVQWNPTGTDSAQLTANYDEATAANAFLNFTGSTSPGNSGVQGCLIYKGSGHTGGTAIKYTGTSTTQRAGGGPIRDVRISGVGTWNWGIRVDCTNITTAGSQGCRDIELSNVGIFQTTTGCMSLNNAVHFDWVHGGCFLTSTNSHVDVTGIAGATTSSTNVGFTDVHILDTVALDFVQNFTCAGCYVNNLTATVNTKASFFDGVAAAGAPTINGQLAYHAFDTGSPAGYGISLTNSIHASNFLSSGAVPANIATGDISASNSTTSGNLKIGSDGNMIVRRNNGSGAGTNIAWTFDGFGTTPFQWDTANGFTTTKQITSTLATGTAPLVIASTTPVANLTVQNCGATCAITQPAISTGVSQGSGFKHQRFGISCTTGAAVGAVCNSAYTWTSAFADANYTVTCTVDGVTSGVPTVNNVNTKAAAGLNVSIAALTAAAAQATNVDCIAVHD